MNTEYPDMPTPQEVTNLASLQTADPDVWEAVQTLLACLRNDMLPLEAQLELFNAMAPAARRKIVQDAAGLEASVVVTFKEQLKLVDNVCRRVISPDGMPLQPGSALGISVKDAMNMSMKIVGIMVKDLPKVITLARVQRKENALLEVIHSLDPASQERALVLLEKLELEAMKNDQ